MTQRISYHLEDGAMVYTFAGKFGRHTARKGDATHNILGALTDAEQDDSDVSGALDELEALLFG